MKRKAIAVVALVIVALSAAAVMLAGAQTKTARPKYEYALLKWDGPDRIQMFYPGKFERFRLSDKVPLPKDIKEEEFCVSTMINDLSKEGWEPIQLHASRVLFRRSADR